MNRAMNMNSKFSHTFDLFDVIPVGHTIVLTRNAENSNFSILILSRGFHWACFCDQVPSSYLKVKPDFNPKTCHVFFQLCRFVFDCREGEVVGQIAVLEFWKGTT